MKPARVLTYMSARRSSFETADWFTFNSAARRSWVSCRAARSSSSGISTIIALGLGLAARARLWAHLAAQFPIILQLPQVFAEEAIRRGTNFSYHRSSPVLSPPNSSSAVRVGSNAYNTR